MPGIFLHSSLPDLTFLWKRSLVEEVQMASAEGSDRLDAIHQPWRSSGQTPHLQIMALRPRDGTQPRDGTCARSHKKLEGHYPPTPPSPSPLQAIPTVTVGELQASQSPAPQYYYAHTHTHTHSMCTHSRSSNRAQPLPHDATFTFPLLAFTQVVPSTTNALPFA